MAIRGAVSVMPGADATVMPDLIGHLSMTAERNKSGKDGEDRFCKPLGFRTPLD